ncbi:MAG: hypothetical protein IPO21_04650 [Bacteroidales bacterium]|nr:hypothetical protein [Bacteroidales bacterium]
MCRKIQRAGADAIELNVSLLPFDEKKTAEENEALYFEVIKKVKENLSIPISLKISHYSSSLSKLIKLLSWTGDVQSLVLFNRFYSPDINIKTNEVTVNNIFSSPDEYTLPLRWIALLSKSVECDLCASTGVHNADSVIKMLLAGASAVQMVSSFYVNGLDHIKKVNDDILLWMQANNYDTISDFKGKITKDTENHKLFVRSQFMKYYSSFE